MGGADATGPVPSGPGTQGEPATGFTLYLDTILRAVPDPAPCPRVFLPIETDDADGARLRSEGWVTVRALESFDDPAAEARRLHCTHIFTGGQILPAA